jgi:hypothetical protein
MLADRILGFIMGQTDTAYAVASTNDGSNNPTAVATFDNEQGQSIDVGPGYDTITGLGEPNGAAFLKAIK